MDLVLCKTISSNDISFRTWRRLCRFKVWLTDYVLDIYLLEDYNLNSEGSVYDKAHQSIIDFNETAQPK